MSELKRPFRVTEDLFGQTVISVQVPFWEEKMDAAWCLITMPMYALFILFLDGKWRDVVMFAKDQVSTLKTGVYHSDGEESPRFR